MGEVKNSNDFQRGVISQTRISPDSTRALRQDVLVMAAS